MDASLAKRATENPLRKKHLRKDLNKKKKPAKKDLKE